LFELPTVAQLATRIEELIHSGGSLSAPPPRKRLQDGRLPLSYAQQRLWFLDQLQTGGNAYNLQELTYLDSGVNLGALEQSLNELVRRHDALRTVFIVTDGEPEQVINPPGPISVTLVDLSALTDKAQQAAAERLRQEDELRPFDLSRGPLFRIIVLRLGGDRYQLLVSMHHIVSDGWSMDVAEREIETIYTAFSQGLPSPLPELQIQYADYAQWQQAWLQGEILQRQIDYWKQQLSGAPTLLELETDRAMPAPRTQRGAALPITFSKEVSRSLRDFSRHEGATLFMTLMAAFQAVLHRYAGQNDIIVGTPIAGRTRSELEPMIGFFVNTVVLRTNFDESPSFRRLLKQVREAALGAHAHQEVPFEKLVEELKPERVPGRNPLCQVIFALQNTGQPTVVTASMGQPRAETKFDLELYLWDTPNGVNGSFIYRTDLYEQPFIERFVKRFQRLIEQVVTQPDAELSTLSLLDEKEYRQVIEEWNDTTVGFPANACIHEVFEQEVEQHPDAIAIEFEDQELSYRELNQRANMLARQLRENGVGPEVFVGVMLERSSELIVTLLAICKASGVYVPINLSDPSSRIRLLLRDAGISTVVTSNEIARRIPDLNVTMVYVDNLGATSREHAENLSSVVTAENLAYLMYTSGSTGTPKGVSITHRNVLRLVKNANYADLNANEVILQFAPISFDASTFEIWGCLLNGGRLVVFPPYMPSLAELSEFITDRGITTAWFTSGLFNQLVDANVQSLSSLRQILAGGEALSPAHVNKALGQLNGRLINGYGPTETTTFACCYDIQPNGERNSIPIGRPISNTSAYVLKGIQPAGIGERGELFIGGHGLGRGYHNQPDLTAERFVPDPYGQPGARLYRTGDVVRYQKQGLIEFLGRVDSQIKLSGFRIELGEIEAALSQHPAVSTALVQMRETHSGDKALVAYVVPNGGVPASHNELKNYLQERLPGYMVPGTWITLDTLPLTRTGKIDRLALPDPAVIHDADIDFAPPRTQLEEVLAAIWERVMGLERVGRNANFFALGGHSLLATRIIARIRDSFQVELPLRAIFEAPTLAQLSEQIEAAMRAGDSLVVPPLVRRSATERLPLSFAQQRLWFLDQLMPGANIYNIPMGLRLTGKINVAALEQSFNEAIRRHESLRTNFIEVNGNPVQVIGPTPKVQLPVVDLVSFAQPQREAIVQQLASVEGQRPFDLASDPLLRGTLLRVAEHEYVLLVVMHHIVSDGWSMHVLNRELRQCYQEFADGNPSLVPDLTIQYADYAYWQRLWLQGEALEAELLYWRTQLKDSPPLLNLPTDYPRPSVSSYEGEALLFEIPAELTQQLKQLSSATGTTLFMTLLASFQMLLSRYSGQDDIVVGTPVAGRRWVETEDLIGFFVNTLVMRTRLSGNPTIREVLARVREVVLESQTHQDLPFEKLVEELQPERTLSHGPLFQVMFGLENTGDAPAVTQTDELGATDVEVKHGAEKNDLTLLVSEQNERLFCRLSYSTALFKESTIKRLRSHWQNVLQAMAADPEQLLRDVQLLGSEERREMLQEWNATRSEFPESQCVFELFAQQVERTPDAIAVSFENERLTYAELDRRANQLAHYLRKHGVANETRVAIFIERSLEMIVALMGVLKAGGAYLPLETKHPKARVKYMLEDAQAQVILTQHKLVTSLPENSATVISLDTDWRLIAAEPDEAPETTIVPENLAYVIYTSGSTGTARGVMVQHRSLVNLASTLRATVYRDRSTPLRVSVNAPLMFDSSVKQLVQLLHGHELVIIPEAIRTDGQEFLAYVKQQQIDVLDCTPSQLRLLLANGLCEESTVYPSLALVGGEALDEETWRLLAGTKQATFFNVYGPTECTVDTTVCRIEPASEGPSIGLPLNNVETYVLDKHLYPVPVGVHGELCIGGAGISRGYILQGDSTAERFVPDPFSDVPGARIYRSGDLTRYRENSEIEFLGRIDYQVKIRGHRIEPGEVETALRKNPRVLEAVVLDREQAGDKRLVAFIVPEHRQTISLTELQNSLKDQLPDYMMPSGWVLLDEMPLTPTGKIDRAALPDPGRARLDTGQSFTVPQTLIEEVLANIWKQVLGVEGIARDDNFFWLGGHSLLATQITSRIRESFHVEIPVRTLFELPTLVELSERIESTMLSGTSMAAPPLERLPDDGPLYLSYAQQRLWFLDQLMPGSNAYNLPAELYIDFEINISTLEQTLSEIVRRHQTLSTTFY
ncbi:MAG TPA: amino acid adenylation domain-containing protein, partial [Pyrinomonadaceae bacterium]